MRLVVENEDVFHAHEFGHDSLDHLAFGFERFRYRSPSALEQRAAAL